MKLFNISKFMAVGSFMTWRLMGKKKNGKMNELHSSFLHQMHVFLKQDRLCVREPQILRGL